MTLEQQALDFADHIKSLYFECRDLEALLPLFDEEAVLIGTGEEEFCWDLETVRRIFAREAAETTHDFTVLETDFQARPLDGGLCAVYGSLRVRENDPMLDLSPIALRFSLLCRLRPQGMRIASLHLSMPDPGQQDGFFPVRLPEESAQMLRQMLERQSAELKARNRDLRALTDNIPGGVLQCQNDDAFTISHMSDGFLSMCGYTAGELRSTFGGRFIELIYPDDRDGVLREVRSQLEAGTTAEYEYRMVRRDGEIIWVLEKDQLIRGEKAKDDLYCILLDISNTKRAQEELRLTLERMQIIMDQTTDIIFEWDIGADTLLFSSNWEKKFGYPPITGQITKTIPLSSHIYPKDRPVFVQIMEDIRQGKPYAQAEFRIQNGEGRYIWCRIRATAQYDAQGLPVKAVGVILDIDSEKRMVQSLRYKAERDALTGLYNKMTTQRLVEEHLADGQPDEQCALFIVDVDNFKRINDTRGHLFGDAVLSGISKQLRQHFRASDIIGRIGGDEFLVFLKWVPSQQFALDKAAQVISSFDSFLQKGQAGCGLSCSIGISLSPDHGQSFQQLYHNADLALYRAKSDGRNRSVLYEPALSESAVFSAASYAGSAIDSENRGKGLEDRLADYVFRVLYQSDRVEEAVDLILEIVGKRHNVSRVYIFEDSEDGSYTVNTFEWCNAGIQSEKANLQRVPYSELDYYYDNFNEDGIFYCRDVSALPEYSRKILEDQDIKSVLQCAIRDGHRNRGFVGFDECTSNRLWTQEQVDTLTLVSEILSTFLLRVRAQDRAEKSAAQMRAVLDHQNSWIYAIDRQSFRLLYLNRKTQEFVPEARPGLRCHSVFFHRESPCDFCPVIQAGGQAVCSREIYNPLLKVWTSTDAVPLDWDGIPACLLTCHDITPYKSPRKD